MSRIDSTRFLRRPAGALGAVLAAALLAAGCGSSADSAQKSDANVRNDHQAADPKAKSDAALCGKESRTIKHDLGSTTVKGDPKRVVVLEFSFVDALINSGIKPVGIADDGQPDRILKSLREATGKYKSVGLRQSPNLQVIKSLKPDLIIADSQRHASIYPQLKKIAPTVAIASNAADYKEVLAGETVIGETVNRCDQMNAALDKHKKAMAALKAKAPAGDKRKILFAVTADKTFGAQTQQSFAPTVLRSLGLKTVPETKGEDAILSMTLESMVTTSPDVVFYAKNTPKTLMDQWQSSQLWKGLPAAKNKDVYEVDGNVWSKSRGTRAAEMVAQQAIDKLSGTS